MTNYTHITMALVLALPAAAAADSLAEPGAATSWSVGIAPRVGLTVPTSELGAMVVGGLAIDVPLPVAERRLVIALDASLTRPDHGGSVMDERINGSGTYEVSVTELKLGVDAIYRFFGADRAFIPFAGIGPILHMLRTTETTSFAPGSNTAQETKLGFEVVVGADFAAGPGYLLGELRGVYSNLDDLLTGDSNAGNVMAAVGYRAVF